MLEESPVGELGRRLPACKPGGGVADIARGEEWFDGSGDRAGDEGLGECCSAGGLVTTRGDARCKGTWYEVDEESSTS